MMRTFFIFLRRLFHDFRRNQGLLLAGAVAYNTLLSLIPLFAVLLVALSHLVDQARLIHTVAINLVRVSAHRERADRSIVNAGIGSS